MVRVIMHGCNGHMGQVITGLIKDDPEIEIVAGVDLGGLPGQRLSGISRYWRMYRWKQMSIIDFFFCERQRMVCSLTVQKKKYRWFCAPQD